MKNEFSFEEIFNMTKKELKKNRCSFEIREDNAGNSTATWCQKTCDNFDTLVIKQAAFDAERKHFTHYVGMESTIVIKDLSLINDLYIP